MAAVFDRNDNKKTKQRADLRALLWLLLSGFGRRLVKTIYTSEEWLRPIMWTSTYGPPLCLHTETAGCPGALVFFTFNASLPQVCAGSLCAEGYYSEFLWSGLRKELAHGGAKWLLPERIQSQEITYWAGKFLKMQVKLVFDQKVALAHKVGIKYVSLPFIMPEQMLRMKINLP